MSANCSDYTVKRLNDMMQHVYYIASYVRLPWIKCMLHDYL